MVKLLLAASFLLSSIAFGQALSYVPAPRAVYISSDGTGNPGTWEPESGTASGTIGYVPQPTASYCSNDGTGNAGTWVPCSSGGSGGSVSITSPDSSITFNPSPLTGTGTAIVNRALTLNTLTFTTANDGITFPSGSQVFEDGTSDLLLQAPAVVGFVADAGLISADLAQTDGTNVGSIFQIFGPTTGGQPSNTSVQVINPNSYGMMAAVSGTHPLLSASNTRETQFGNGTNTSGTLSTFAPTFAIGNAVTVDAQRTIVTPNGALSAPAMLFNGTPVITGGSGTTTWPLVLLQPSATTTTTWNTAGTMFGINGPSGFTGNIVDFQVNGSSFFKIGATGSLSGNLATFATYSTTTNCSSSASPAVCSGSASGSVAVPAAGTTLVVDTTRITANSQVLLTFDSSLGTRLSVTCNTTINQPSVSARTAGTSFTITMASALSANPDCISYTIIN